MRGHTQTHNLTQYTRSHSKWWHGNTTVNPDWGPSAGLTSLPPQRNKPVEVYNTAETLTLQTASRCRWLQQIHFLVCQSCVFIFFLKKFLTCFCFYLFTSRSERVAWWDKDAGEPHPSTHRPTQTGAVHMSQAKNVLWWFLCYISPDFRWMCVPLIVPVESRQAFGVFGEGKKKKKRACTLIILSATETDNKPAQLLRG